jgi:hypothetical protein
MWRGSYGNTSFAEMKALRTGFLNLLHADVMFALVAAQLLNRLCR